MTPKVAEDTARLQVKKHGYTSQKLLLLNYLNYFSSKAKKLKSL